MAKIDYDQPGVPVLRAVFTDLKGRPLWTEEAYQFSNMSAVGEFLVEDSVAYVVKGVAVCEGIMYVNLALFKDSLTEIDAARSRPGPVTREAA